MCTDRRWVNELWFSHMIEKLAATRNIVMGGYLFVLGKYLYYNIN